MKSENPFDVVIFIGIPASGKTTFYRERFFPAYVYISLDQIRTRSAEAELFSFCLRRRKNCVIDNTNVKRQTRAHYISAAMESGARVIGYCFPIKPDEAIRRNATRVGRACVPEHVIKRIYGDFVYPKLDEGFDALYFVTLGENGYEVESYDEEK